jgi:hypothetical protein
MYLLYLVIPRKKTQRIRTKFKNHEQRPLKLMLKIESQKETDNIQYVPSYTKLKMYMHVILSHG